MTIRMALCVRRMDGHGNGKVYEIMEMGEFAVGVNSIVAHWIRRIPGDGSDISRDSMQAA